MDGHATEAVYASFWRRLGAFVADQLLLGGFAFLWFAALANMGRTSLILNLGVTVAAILVAPWLYTALFESGSRQATPGKQLLRIKVTDLRGARIGFARATGRHFAEWLSILTLLVGYALAIFTRRRQAMHDLLAGTLVVREDAAPAAVAGSERAAPMSGGALAGALAVVLAALSVPVGYLALAIPAYRDFEVRTQIAEGLTLAHEFELAVDLHRIEYGEWPADLTALQIDDYTQGLVNEAKFVDAIEIVDGTVVVRFNAVTHADLQNRRLALRPWLNEDEQIAWQCGRAEPPPGAWNNSAGPRGNGSSSRAVASDLPDRHLPVSCRAGFTFYEWQ